MSKVLPWSIRAVFFLVFIYGIFTLTKLTMSRHSTDKSAIPITAAERERQLDCLTRNIYFEAGTEPFEGKVAVAQVTLNRANSHRYPNDICKVVFQKNIFYEKVVCQFSWYCEKGNKVVEVKNTNYKESEIVARKVLLEEFRLPSLTGAFYYHADYVQPNWNLPKITKIGRHIFYGENK